MHHATRRRVRLFAKIPTPVLARKPITRIDTMPIILNAFHQPHKENYSIGNSRTQEQIIYKNDIPQPVL